MLTKFWEAAGGRLVDRWLAVSMPALLFWFGGGLAVALSDWSAVDTWLRWLTARHAVVQGAALVAALVVVGGSALVVERLTEPALHVIEGYWPAWALRLRRALVSRSVARVAAMHERLQELHQRMDAADAALAPEDFAEFLRLDRALRREPLRPYRWMPTRVGRILRAADSFPYDKYGLDTVAVWPRLWLLLPETARAELVAARRAMTAAVAATLWGLLFTAFAAVTPWAVPVGLAVAGLALWGWLPGRAQTYGDLVEATFDVHRGLLYAHLRWPLPASPVEEKAAGLAVSTYLWRGSDAAEPTFVPARTSEDDSGSR